MGESSRARPRSISPSRRHRAREDERPRGSNSSTSQSHRPRKDGDRSHKHRKDRDTERDETEEERRERKRAKREKERVKEEEAHDRLENGHGHGREGRQGKRKSEREMEVVDDDEDGDLWVEKGVEAADAAAHIPTSQALNLTSNVSNPHTPLPPPTSAGSFPQERDSWMLDPGSLSGPSSASRALPPTREMPQSAGTKQRDATSSSLTEGYGDEDPSHRTQSGGVDFFSALGTEHKRKDPRDDRPDPSTLQVHATELNRQLLEGKTVDEYEVKEKKAVPGGPGFQWRMMKLRKLYEQAEEQGRNVEDIALERYGSMDEFNEALQERRILDEREHRRNIRRGNSVIGIDGVGGGGLSTPGSSGMRTPDVSGGRKYMFTGDEGAGSRPASRAGFRRPGEVPEMPATSGGRVEELRRRESGIGGSGLRSTPGGPKISTPVPSVFTPTGLTRTTSYPFETPAAAGLSDSSAADPTASTPPLSLDQLNRLQAKVLRAKLMEEPNARELEEEYDQERARAEIAGMGMWAGSASGAQGQLGRVEEDGTRVDVQVLPTLDGRGRLYDVGQGKEDAVQLPGNRRKKVDKFETRDKEGNLLRYNADDDEMSLGELVRQERFGAGPSDQKNLDAEMAAGIARDGKFEDDLDYMDDNADRIARKKMKTDAMKRQFAINDYARTKRALDTCPFCYQDDRPPLTAIVALGTRTYMCCTQTEELVPGHCLIVPLQHCLSSLEMEDDDWEEVRNFMKCLMRMHAKDNNGVLFYETILSFRQQRHTFIEAVPVPFEQFQDCPAYFRESILASESEWTQHKKLIDFSTRPGGFRRALVPNLPYFMVQWDYKGEKGYGHVIEGVGDAAGRGQGEEDVGGPVDEGDKGGGEFPPWFAAEIIGNILGLEPRKWMRPRKMDYALNKERARELGTKFQPYNWTVQLQQQ